MGTDPAASLPPRYRFLTKLGHGELSCVLMVEDRFVGKRRALKLATVPGQERRFQREFRRLGELRHPNIVRSYDFGSTANGRPFFTLEHVRGQRLDELARDRATTLDPTTVAALAMQILDALATMHARGWVHRDVTPSNIMVSGSGPSALVRLFDLGLTTRVNQVGRAGGTLPYVAPEVLREEPVDGRADLYGLGVLLYDLLLPSSTAQSLEEVMARQRGDLTPPNRLNPVVPAAFSDFVLRLARRERDDRFPHTIAAIGALASIESLRQDSAAPRVSADRILRGGATSHRPSWIRRARLLAQRALDQGRGAAVAIGGPVGVGKTPLLRELALELSLGGMRVLALRATEQPGSPLDELARGSALSGNDSGAHRLHDPERRPPPHEVARQLTMGLANTPTAVLIDDVQRINGFSLQVLEAMTALCQSAPLLLITASDPKADGTSWPGTLGGGSERWRLRPLTRRAVERLMKQRLNGLEVPDVVVERITRDTRGQPSLVERTLAQLLAEGAIVPSNAGFRFEGGKYRVAEHGDAEVVRQKMAGLSEPERYTLWAAAVLRQGMTHTSLAAVAGLDPSTTAHCVSALVRVDLLRPSEASDEPRFKLPSRSAWQAVYRSIPADLRPTLHDLAAQLPVPSGGRREDEVEHLLRGSHVDAAVEAAVRAAARAAGLGEERRAIEYLSRAYARISTGHARAPDVARQLGLAFRRTGELERARTWLGRALGSMRHASPERAEVVMALGMVALAEGHIDSARTLARQAEVEMGRGLVNPVHRARCARLVGLVAVHGGDARRGRALLRRAVRDLTAAASVREVHEAALDLSRSELASGDVDRAVQRARRVARAAKRLGDVVLLAEADRLIARGHGAVGDHPRAYASLRKALRAARQAEDRLREGLLLRELGNVSVNLGRTKRAFALYNRAYETSKSVSARDDMSATLHNIGVLRSRCGEPQAAMSALGEALALSQSSGDARGVSMTRIELARLHADLGAADLAWADLNAVDRQRVADPAVLAEHSAVTALLLARRGAANQPDVGHHLLEAGSLCAGVEEPAPKALVLALIIEAAVAANLPMPREHLDALTAVVDVGHTHDLAPLVYSAWAHWYERQGNLPLALERAEAAAHAARKLGYHRWLATFLLQLARLQGVSLARLASLTDAMELTRATAEELPPEMTGPFLADITQQAMCNAFRAAWRQTSGHLVASPQL